MSQWQWFTLSVVMLLFLMFCSYLLNQWKHVLECLIAERKKVQRLRYDMVYTANIDEECDYEGWSQIKEARMVAKDALIATEEAQ